MILFREHNYMVRFRSAVMQCLRFWTRPIPDVPFLKPIISIPFMIGLLLGSITGTFLRQTQNYILLLESSAFSTENTSFISAFWRAFRFPCFSVLLATGILGAALIPALSAFRGFVFACSVAIILGRNTLNAFPITFNSVGIPAYLKLKPIFITSSAGCAV